MQQAGHVRLYGKRGFYDKFEHIVIVILTVLIAVFMSFPQNLSEHRVEHIRSRPSTRCIRPCSA